MKFSIDGKEICSLSPFQEKVIQSIIPSENYIADMERRLKWYIIQEHCGTRYSQLREEWIPKLKARGAKSIPIDDEEFAQLVFSQLDYQDASAKNAAAIAAFEARIKEI